MDAELIQIRPTIEADWRNIRDLRLEMLNDTPIAFGETAAEASTHSQEEWRLRGSRGTGSNSVTLAAITGDGKWVGTMGSYIADSSTGPLLVGVYVSPDFRGTPFNLTDQLLHGIEDWARENGGRLTLHVHEDNIRAQKAYLKRGFELTGHSVEYSLDPKSREVEMVKELSA